MKFKQLLKPIFTTLIITTLALGVNQCDNTDEAAAVATATCSITADGFRNELSSACLSGTEVEHIRIEGLTLAVNEKVEIWLRSTTSDTVGAKFTLDAGADATNGTITYDNLTDTGTEITLASQDMTGSQTYCFDAHFAEGHILSWKGTNCDTTYASEAAAGAASIINDDDGNGTVTATNTGIYYKITSGATVSKVTVKGALVQ